MKIDPRCIRTHLQNFDFDSLFIEDLGWDKSPNQTPLGITIESQEFILATVAEKRGFVALHCKANKQTQVPGVTLRRRIHQEVSHFYREHLIIYADHSQTQQIWQWVDRRLGFAPVYREATFCTSYDLKILSFEQINQRLVQNGWINPNKEPIRIQIADKIYQLSLLAEKLGALVYGCEPDEQGSIPNASSRQKIDDLIGIQSFIRLVIYNDRQKSEQIWQWGVSRRQEIIIYENPLFNSKKYQNFLMRVLAGIAFSWEEEEGLSLFEVVHRVEQAFSLPIASRQLINRPFRGNLIPHRSSLTSYLQEIGRIRLLRAAEEIELARKIADLIELERIRDRLCDRLEREPHDGEWASEVNMPLRAFQYRLHLGRRAKDKMVQSNLRLVVSIAKKYMNRGLAFQDLIQEGNLGLIRAAEKFDHEKGYKFSTYATWWIRQAITRAIADQSRTIRLPVHLYETISRIKKTTKLLSQEMGRKPTEAEIATRMEMTIEQLRFIKRVSQHLISLNVPVQYTNRSLQYSGYWEGDFIEPFIEFGECLHSDIESPEYFTNRKLLKEDIAKVLSCLSFKERVVIKLRYGFLDGTMKTLEEIALIFNVTRERIRQIEAKALRKLRNSNRNKILKEYIL